VRPPGCEERAQAGELLRLEWRQAHVVVNSRHIYCVTYDQLLRDLLLRLDQYAPPRKGGAEGPTLPAP
jgi:hypothetical protein